MEGRVYVIRGSERGGETLFRATPEQEARINAEIERVRKMGRPPQDTVTQLVTGFVLPNQIFNYHCPQCKGTYDGAPRIEVVIDRRPEVIHVSHICPKGHFAVMDYLKEGERIPEEFICFDSTGDYKRPTAEAIEKLFDQIRLAAGEGNIEGRRIEILERWANKIGYQLNREGLSQAIQTAEAVQLRKFEEILPELVDEILEKDYGFDLGNAGECTNFEGTGVQERMDYLLANLPRVPLPKDKQVREKLQKILRLNIEMYVYEKQRLENEREEFLRKSANRIGNLEKEVMKAREEEQKLLLRISAPA